MVIKTVTNADTGTADIVGGDDWDAMATIVNNLKLPTAYTIFKSGTTTYAMKGSDQSILTSDSHSDTVIQAALDALPTTDPWGGKVYIKYASTGYTIDTKLTVPAAHHGIAIELESPYTVLTYTGTDACIEVGGTGTQTIGFEYLGGRIFCSSTTGSPVGLRLKNLNHARLYRVRVNGNTSGDMRAIELNGGANFNADIQMYGVYLHNCKIGIKVTNGAANAIGIYGGFIGGNTGPVAGSYGIDKDGGDTWQVYGVDIENMETALREQAIDAPYGSSIFDFRVENCTNYVTTATSNNRFGGTTTSTIITDTGTLNDFTAPTIETYNRPKNFAGTVGDVAITNASSPYTVLTTKRMIRADATSGAITINLPTAVGIAGREYHIFRTDILSSVNPVTIDASSTQTIDSNLTYILWPGEWVKLESDGANWQVIGRPTPTAYGYYFVKGTGPNRRYVSNQGGVQLGTSTTLPAVDTLFAFPFIVSRTTKFDTISFRITTVASAGGVARQGIYRDSGNSSPGALIFDSGSIDTTSGGGAAPRTVDTTITAGLQVFQPGLYWLAWVCGVAAPQVKIYSAPYGLLNMLQWDSAMSTVNVATGFSMAHAFAALPDPFSVTPTTLAGTPSATVPYIAQGLRPV